MILAEYFQFQLNKDWMAANWNATKKIISAKELSINPFEIEWIEKKFFNVGFASLELLEKSNEFKLLNSLQIPFDVFYG